MPYTSSIVIFPQCPHCKSKSIAFYILHAHDSGREKTNIFLECGNCEKGVCAEINSDILREFDLHHIDFSMFNEVYPRIQENNVPKHIPLNIAKKLIEAKNNLDINSIESSCFMVRSALETALVNLGENNGGLKSKIKALANNHIITPALADWADEIRTIGNDAAHQAEREAELTKQDAKEGIYFAEMLLMYLYTLPGMIAERRSRPPKAGMS